jgi:phosphatidylserine/phosphatidylglycerophosphate/cardiolipin synthase-like enzyme
LPTISSRRDSAHEVADRCGHTNDLSAQLCHQRVSAKVKERTVDLRLIADNTTACERASDIPPLAAAGVPIWIDREARIVHAKTMVIDGAVTLIGSMNWTYGAADALETESTTAVLTAFGRTAASIPKRSTR